MPAQSKCFGNPCRATPAIAAMLVAGFLLGASAECFAIGQTPLVEFAARSGSFPIVGTNITATIFVDSGDWIGVTRAAADLRDDIRRVTGRTPQLVRDPSKIGSTAILVGTIGKSATIDRLVQAGKIEVSTIAGAWESSVTEIVSDPLPGVSRALVIAGSDKRGTIYAIYNVSEQIGVSPWYYWADVAARRHDLVYARAGRFVFGPPSVRYRGIFLNDEAPDLTNWILAKYGEVAGRPGVANYGRGFYTNLFELILRLRGNYLWPAMWNNAFNEDDPENPRLADEYGIVMGTTHQEPMLRAQKEWDRGPGRQFGNWNYNSTNQQVGLQQFWRGGIPRNKGWESIVTLGLRAENDSGVPIGKDLTEQIVNTQRKILAEELNPDLTKVPQLWCLYKEVQGFYENGLRVPGDVTLLWTDDNWGNLRRLPGPTERVRRGGAGVYYHLDYHGGPRSYQWINTSPIPKMWDQLSLAKQYGADRIWIVNVGHFKGYEFPMEFFLNLACDTPRWTNDNLDEFTRLWAEREFGPEHADQIANIVTAYTRYNGRRKPELLDASTYSLVNYQEFEKVVADYQAVAERAQEIERELLPESRDAYYQLVLFPAKASAQLNALYLAAAKNALFASQGRASANDFAARTRALFAAQTNLMDQFNHEFAGGKWNHFMDQTHIGYVSWNDPPHNSLNAVHLTDLSPPEPAALGVAIEGSTAAWPGETNEPALPQFDALNRQRQFFDVFNKGREPFQFAVTADQRWIRVSESSGKITQDKRLWISVDWTKAPKGKTRGAVKISGAGSEVNVRVDAFNPVDSACQLQDEFVEGDGCVSIEAEHYVSKSDAGANRWIKIPGYGQTLSAIRASGPADTQVTPGSDAPCLQYRMYFFSTGTFDVEGTFGPTLNFLPGRALRCAVSFDDEPPRIITIVPANFSAQNGNREWEESVKNNCRRVRTAQAVAQPGAHTLKIWMVDPGVVLEKIVVNTGGVRPSYFGPPESFRARKT